MDYELYAIKNGKKILMPSLLEICEQDGFAHKDIDIRVKMNEKMTDIEIKIFNLEALFFHQIFYTIYLQ